MKTVCRLWAYFVIASVLSVSILGCSDFDKNTYTALKTSKEFYNSALSASADAYKQGIINEEQKNQVIRLGEIYMGTHNTAVYAFEEWKRVENMENKEKVIQALKDMFADIRQLETYVEKILGKDVELPSVFYFAVEEE